MAFLDHIRACNNAGDLSDWLPFRVSGATVGTVRGTAEPRRSSSGLRLRWSVTA